MWKLIPLLFVAACTSTPSKWETADSICRDGVWFDKGQVNGLWYVQSSGPVNQNIEETNEISCGGQS